jgi:hypothetical protein
MNDMFDDMTVTLEIAYQWTLMTSTNSGLQR